MPEVSAPGRETIHTEQADCQPTTDLLFILANKYLASFFIEYLSKYFSTDLFQCGCCAFGYFQKTSVIDTEKCSRVAQKPLDVTFVSYFLLGIAGFQLPTRFN